MNNIKKILIAAMFAALATNSALNCSAMENVQNKIENKDNCYLKNSNPKYFIYSLLIAVKDRNSKFWKELDNCQDKINELQKKIESLQEKIDKNYSDSIYYDFDGKEVTVKEQKKQLSFEEEEKKKELEKELEQLRKEKQKPEEYYKFRSITLALTDDIYKEKLGEDLSKNMNEFIKTKYKNKNASIKFINLGSLHLSSDAFMSNDPRFKSLVFKIYNLNEEDCKSFYEDFIKKFNSGYFNKSDKFQGMFPNFNDMYNENFKKNLLEFLKDDTSTYNFIIAKIDKAIKVAKKVNFNSKGSFYYVKELEAYKNTSSTYWEERLKNKNWQNYINELNYHLGQKCLIGASVFNLTNKIDPIYELYKD